MGDAEIHALGFDYARQLRDPALREHLKDIGWTNEPIVPVEPTSTIRSIRRRIDRGGAHLLAMRDEQAPLGWRFMWWERAGIVSPPTINRGGPVKETKRFVVVLDATFGADPTDKDDEDENAYHETAEYNNILDAIAAGEIDPAKGLTVYLELNTGDVVRGKLVSINVDESS